MDEQLRRDREYLNHCLRNNVLKIQGCLHMIEEHLRSMDAAVRSFEETCRVESHGIEDQR